MEFVNHNKIAKVSQINIAKKSRDHSVVIGKDACLLTLDNTKSAKLLTIKTGAQE